MTQTFGFIVPTCLRLEEHVHSLEMCVQSLKQYHPHTLVVLIVDPSSTLHVPPLGDLVLIQTYTGDIAADMIMYDFFFVNHYFDIACFIQDSMVLKKPVVIDTTFTHIHYLWSFTNHRVEWDIIKEPITGQSHQEFIRDCITQYVHKEPFKAFALTELPQRSKWIGCFGLLSICTHTFVTWLETQTSIIQTMKCMGTDNRKRRAIESIFSLAVPYALHTFKIPVYDGLYYDGHGGGHGLESALLKKTCHNRERIFPLPRITATGDSHSILFLYLGYVTEHYLGFNTDLPLTMHRCGTEGLDLSQIHTRLGNGHERFPIKKGDTVIYCYGYNDVQYRIFEQTKHRSLEEVLQTLVDKYIQTIMNNEKTYQVQSCIYAVLPPPSKPIEHVTVGTIEERVHATQRLNNLLKEQCTLHHFKFLDLSPFVTNEQGTMVSTLSSDGIHLDKPYVSMLHETLSGMFDTSVTSILKRDVESFDR